MKKELYYIRGNAERKEEVKAALQEKYPNVKGKEKFMFSDFDEYDCLYYVENGLFCESEANNSTRYDFIIEYGTELYLPEKEPEVAVGDVAFSYKENTILGVVTKVDKDYICGEGVGKFNNFKIGDIRIASPREISDWNLTLRSQHLHYSRAARKLEHWFLPFDRVLVRSDKFDRWTCDIFSYYDKEADEEPYVVSGGVCYKFCLPYNMETGYAVGKTENPEEAQF